MPPGCWQERTERMAWQQFSLVQMEGAKRGGNDREKVAPGILTWETVSDTPIQQHKSHQKSSKHGRKKNLSVTCFYHFHIAEKEITCLCLQDIWLWVQFLTLKKKRQGKEGWKGRNSLVRTRIIITILVHYQYKYVNYIGQYLE